MIRIVLLLSLVLCAASRADAAVLIQLAGDDAPVLVQSVYLRDGTIFLPLREILPPLHLSGVWDGAKRLYRIRAASGEIILAPGSRQIRYSKISRKLKQPPRFFAGELCVPEEVVTTHLPDLLGLTLTYVNQDGDAAQKQLQNEDQSAGATNSPLPLQQIIIDPGHGGNDPGAISPDGIKEKDLTLALGLRLEKLLKIEGLAPILLTRDGDYAVALHRRSGILRGAAEENLLISLHVAAWRSSETHGCTLYLLPQRDNTAGEEDLGFFLAQSLREALRRAGVADCSIERASLFPLSNTPFPAVLLELGYLTNPEELSLLASSDGQERITRALTLGVKKYAEIRQRRSIDVPATQ